MYPADRYVFSHGAVVLVGAGYCGLIAGCGFAVHTLEAHFDDLAAKLQYATIRIYVDDITLTVRAMRPDQVVRNMSVELPICQAGLLARHQVSNQAKEQAYSSSSAVLKLWNKRRILHTEVRSLCRLRT